MYVCFNNSMSCFSASVRDLNALVCSPSVSPIVSPISINVVCRCMIFHVHAPLALSFVQGCVN